MADFNDPLPGSGVSFWTMAAAAAATLAAVQAIDHASGWME